MKKNEEGLFKSMGVDEKRSDRLVNVCLASMMNSEKLDDAFEKVIRDFQPKTTNESVLVGYTIAKFLEIFKKI